MMLDFEVWVNHIEFNGWTEPKPYWTGKAMDHKAAAEAAARQYIDVRGISTRNAKEPIMLRVYTPFDKLSTKYFCTTAFADEASEMSADIAV